ncbi:MAG: alpha/beta hydrolase-fold protein [Verrucomicrobiota bacterium]
MKPIRLLCALGLALVTVAELDAAEALTRREWLVDGVRREALVYVPPSAKSAATPVVFAFHGHGGTMGHAARTFGYHTLWPEALVVYPQGLPTPGRLTDPAGKKAGWQSRIGDQGDRDLKFFDALLAALQADYRVDEKRRYATGHSNGGSFTYLLWAARGDQFAALAPSAAPAGRNLALLKPKPVLHVAGEKDALVKFAWQQQTMNALRKLNDCGEGKPWAKACTVYESKRGAPVVTFLHSGAHQFPAAAPALIVRFFQETVAP